ncbi:serine/threonine protein kinase [Nostoc sp. CHAB 5844]|nr:serine/threonine protein kinase [Nostoc sp. CHAB 5844]
MIGKLLDQRYRVVEKLGKGGFGHTYLALDTRRPGNPTCVVKHLQPATDDPDFLPTARRLFSREAETLEKLGHHDQIPRLLAYFEENEEFYLVQEFVAGQPLSLEMSPGVRWTEEQVIKLLQEVLPILDFVHSNGVIHRDIKPDNLIRRVFDNKIVLVDFGSVKQVKSYSRTIPEHLQTETVAIGTPGYMPSEQGQGRPRRCSDIYALGMTSIQALTGLNPTQFGEDSANGEILWRHHTQVSDQLASILNKMVRHYFKYRYQSATEVIEVLASVTNPNTPAAVGAVVSQMVSQYLAEGYVSATKVMHYIKELAKPCYSSPDIPTVSGTTQPSKVMHYIKELAKPCYSSPDIPTISGAMPSTASTTPIVANAQPAALSTSSGLRWRSMARLPQAQFFWGAGSAIALTSLIIISTHQAPQSSTQSAKSNIKQVASNTTEIAQKNSCLVVISSSNLRTYSSTRQLKTGKVIKAGTQVIATGKQKGGWIEISSPESGWVWKGRTKNSCVTK